MKKLLTKNCLLRLVLPLMLLSALSVGVCSCKAWRTISTSATYVQQSDSTGKASATITTKTVEEYQGVKKK